MHKSFTENRPAERAPLYHQITSTDRQPDRGWHSRFLRGFAALFGCGMDMDQGDDARETRLIGIMKVAEPTQESQVVLSP